MSPRSGPPAVCEIGRVYDMFRIKALLGRGGIAEVYLVEHTTMRTEMALKVLRVDQRGSEESVRRFEAEGRALAELSHPNVVRVIFAGESAALGPFMAMEVLVGKTLAQILSTSIAIPLGRAVPLALDVASTMAFVHGRGILHRDLKPDNLFVPPGAPLRVIVLDLGAAKAEKYELPPTEEGRVIGTYLFMSPEQIKGARLTPASDVYALAHILWQMLVGHHAHAPKADTPKQALHVHYMDMHVTTDAPRLIDHLPGVCVELSDVVAQGMLRDPSERFATMEAFGTALQFAWKKQIGGQGTRPMSGRPAPIPTGSLSFEEALEFPLPTGAWSPESMEEALTQRRPSVGEVASFVRTYDPEEELDADAPTEMIHVPRGAPIETAETAEVKTRRRSEALHVTLASEGAPPSAPIDETVIDRAPPVFAPSHPPLDETVTDRAPPQVFPSQSSPTTNHAFVPNAAATPSPHDPRFFPSSPSMPPVPPYPPFDAPSPRSAVPTLVLVAAGVVMVAAAAAAWFTFLK